MGEYELGLASAAGLISSTILRFHNVYGFPTEFASDRAQVIPSLARKAARHPDEDFVVWGSGKQRRSFVFVEDVVDALVLGLDRGKNAGPIQIGPAESSSVSEIALLLAEISGKGVAPTFDESKPEGDRDRVGSSALAKQVLGWTPSTSLRDGLEKTYAWVSDQIVSGR